MTARESPPETGRAFSTGSSGWIRTGRGAGEAQVLGLAIAREIVVAHEGTVTIGSRAGGGTCVTVRLPLSQELASR